MKNTELAWVMYAVVIVMFFIGIAVGYLSPHDVRREVIEASGKYVNFFKMMKDYTQPFNENDNVTMTFYGSNLIINHTYPNQYGIRFFNIGFDSDGMIDYVTELRERQ